MDFISILSFPSMIIESKQTIVFCGGSESRFRWISKELGFLHEEDINCFVL